MILLKPINSENPSTIIPIRKLYANITGTKTRTAVKSKTVLNTLITKVFLNAVIDCIEPPNLVKFSP